MSLLKQELSSSKELCTIGLPLSICAISSLFMGCIDRMCANFISQEAFQAIVNAITFSWVFFLGIIFLTNISEVFVAKYNGEGKKEQLGEPTWQMLWMSALSALFFIPFALWGLDWVYGSSTDRQLEKDYLFWVMLAGPFFAANGALIGFFVGQKQTKLVTFTVVSCNLCNVVLDLLLMFGWKNWIPALHLNGAALATSFSQILQFFILLKFFLSTKNVQQKGTSSWQFQAPLFLDCLKIGIPGALLCSFEVMGWALFYEWMTIMGPLHITIAGTCQTFYLLFIFFGHGLEKAVLALSANLIGAKKESLIPKLALSGLKLHLIYYLMTLTGLYLFFELIYAFFQYENSLPSVFRQQLFLSLFLMISALCIESIKRVIGAILTSYGDTFFQLITNNICMAAILLTPIYFFLIKENYSIAWALLFTFFYQLCSLFIYCMRYLLKYQKKVLATA